MEAPNIQLYNLCRQELRLTDGKSLELMQLLDKEYKSGVKEDIASLANLMDTRFGDVKTSMDTRFGDVKTSMDTRFRDVKTSMDIRFREVEESMDTRFKEVDARFDKVDARFEKIDARFEKIEDRLNSHDKRFDALDNKIDLKTAELRSDITRSHASIVTWMLGIVLSILALFIASLFKK